MSPYYRYSEYLRRKYGEKAYKLPVNIPVSCPNRDGTVGAGGCIFCGGKGAGFECLSSEMPVREQIYRNMSYIGKKYNAKVFIAYFQNFSNTYLELPIFKQYMNEAADTGVAQIDISTRPDCISDEYLKILRGIAENKGVNIGIELGLQSANWHTLKALRRGHGLAAFVDAAASVKKYDFELCVHVIIDLPWDDDLDLVETARIISVLGADSVKMHSLYVVKDTPLAEMYQKGELKLLSKQAYIDRAVVFLENLKPDIAIQRLIGRAPEEDTVIANFGSSWWVIKEDIEKKMLAENRLQGGKYCQPRSAAVRKYC